VSPWPSRLQFHPAAALVWRQLQQRLAAAHYLQASDVLHQGRCVVCGCSCGLSLGSPQALRQRLQRARAPVADDLQRFDLCVAQLQRSGVPEHLLDDGRGCVIALGGPCGAARQEQRAEQAE